MGPKKSKLCNSLSAEYFCPGVRVVEVRAHNRLCRHQLHDFQRIYLGNVCLPQFALKQTDVSILARCWWWYVGNLCTFDSDCGGGLITGTCKVGSGFAATITAVSSGSITEIYITDPGEGYSSNPKLVVSSGSCTCAGAAGNVQGSMDTCLISARNTGINRRKSHWVEDQAADVSWSSMAGWANDGDTSACTASSPAPCPFVSDLSSTPGWRWSIGRDGANANYLTGLVDEIRVSSSAIALPYESLWRP